MKLLPLIGMLMVCGWQVAFAETEKPQAIAELAHEWKLVGIVKDGQEIPAADLPDICLEIMKDGLAKARIDGNTMDISLEFNSEASPKQMDIFHTAGELNGQQQYAIYELNEGKLKVVASEPGATKFNRPADFTTGMVLTFERADGAK